MKLARCGDLSALGLLARRGMRQILFINWANLLTRRGPNGLARSAMYLRGLYDSFLLPVDRRACLYRAPRGQRQ